MFVVLLVNHFKNLSIMSKNTFSIAALDNEYQNILSKLDGKEYTILTDDGETLDVPISRIHPAAIISFEEDAEGLFIITVNEDWSI